VNHVSREEQRPSAILSADLTALFPRDRILLEPAAIAAWAGTTHPLDTSPIALVVPITRDETRAAVLAARRCGVAVAAISRGRNIGLGARIPPLAEGAPLIVDMQLQRSIRAIDEYLGVVELEPGVTFEQLHVELRRRGSRWFLPATGGPPDGSVVGNLLERGDGTGPYGDRVRAFLDLEALLPTGEVVSTRRDAAGPDISGLFFQSGVGIVTAASLSLAPLPRVMTQFVMRLRAGSALRTLVDAARVCTQHGILLPGAVCIWNGTKRAIRDGGDDATDGWVISGSLHAASARRAEADWADLMDALRDGGADVDIVHHESIAAPRGIGLLEGEPNDANLVSIVSGLRDGKGSPGFAWLCPVIPFDGAAAETAMAIVAEELERAGLRPNMALGCRDARTIRGYVALAWDRDDPAAESLALQAHDRLLARLDQAGFPPFRLGHLSRGWKPAARDDTARVTERLVAALGA
jgi:4-cresol dehydrogenase (hydroxylating) flavoprotein subunit